MNYNHFKPSPGLPSRIVAVFCLFLPPTAMAQAKPGRVSFSRDIAPILALRCQGCHNTAKAAFGFDVTTYAKLRMGGKKSGPQEILVPGKPDESVLLDVLLADAAPRMPLKLKPLTADQILAIRQWIEQGAECDALSPDTPLTSIVSPEQLLATPKPSDKSQVATRPALALSADGEKLFVGENGFVTVTNLRTNAVEGLKIGPVSGRIQSLWVDPAASFLVVTSGRAGLEGVVSRWDVRSGKKIFESRPHADQILSTAISPELKLIATGSYDRSIALTDLATGTSQGTLKEHTDAVYAVAFGPAAVQRLVSASGDRTMKLWDLKAKKRLETFSESTAELYAVAFSGDGKTAASAGVDRTIRAYDLSASPPRLAQSALAHEGPITGMGWMQATGSGPVLLTTSEDRSIRRWHPATLKQLGESLNFSDWPTVFSAGGQRLAASVFDGSIAVFEPAQNELKKIWEKPAGSARGGHPDSFKPQLSRPASLNPPVPRVLPGGRDSIVSFTGLGLERATRAWVFPGDITVEILKPKEIKPNTVEVRIKTPARTHFEMASIRFATPLGITPEQTFGLAPAEITTSQLSPSKASGKPKALKTGDVWNAAITAPGEVAQAEIELKPNELLTISTLAKALNSSLTPELVLKSSNGRHLATASSKNNRDPVLSYRAKAADKVILELSDALMTGSGSHFAYLHLNASPLVADHWPDARPAAKATSVTWKSNSGGSAETKLQVIPKLDHFQLEPLQAPAGWVQELEQSILTVPGSVHEMKPEPAWMAINDAAVGRFLNPSEFHEVRFKAKKNQRLVIETYARRLGRNVDTAIEILDDNKNPVNHVNLRKVADTLIAFRDHASTIKGIRLTQWPDFQMGNYVLVNREVARIFQLPRNPDDDCQFWGDEQRWGYFGTTPEQHPMGRTITKVEIVPPGQESSVPPNLLVRIPYHNDDAGMTYGNDSYLDFNPPADGDYRVRIRETRGAYGPGVSYALALRQPKPDFQFSLSPMDWNIPVGGSRIVTASIRRIDNFQGPVAVELKNLPAGWKATPCVIESGQLSADFLIEIPPGTPEGFIQDARWTATAKAQADGTSLTKEINGINRSLAVVPKSNMVMTTSVGQLDIRPGEISTLKIKAHRGEAFTGRIPIDVKNLAYGVRVLDIGLNGILITERETEREIRIYAEPWVQPQSRPFYAVGRAENAGTADSTPPVYLKVNAATGQTNSNSNSVSAAR